MNNGFVILTDSSADLSQELVRKLDVQVLPLSFILQGKTYQDYPDNRQMDPKAFYAQLREGNTATTSAVNVAQYVDAVEPLLQAGKDVLILAFSSGLSTTYNSSVIAVEELSKKYPRRKLYTVDTLCASLGQGMLVALAADRRAAGDSIEEVRDWVEENKGKVCHQVTVDDLHFLKRGGRISATSAVVGSMLSIKPMIFLDDEGHLINNGKIRGRHAALKELLDRMAQTVVRPEEQTIYISHGDCLEDAQLVADLAKERFGVKDVIIHYVGPVIGAHTGPGVVALFYLGEHR